MDAQTFWNQLLDLLEAGNRTSDANYYIPGGGGAEAGEADFRNVAKVLLEKLPSGSMERKQAIDLLVTSGFLKPEEASYWYVADATNIGNQDALQNAAAQRFPTMFGTDAGGGVNTKPGAPAEETQAETGVGGGGSDPATQLTILTGQKMKWYFDPNGGKWYVSYGLPNSTRELAFEATPEQMDALFGVGYRPTSFERVTFKDYLARPNVTFGGNVAEMEGTGQFESEYQRIVSLALDEGKLPDWVKADPAATDIIFIAQSEGKSNEWIMDQLSTLQSFQARFPGLEAIRQEGNLTLTDAVTGFLEFEAGVKALQKEFSGTEAVTPEVIGALLNQGYTLTYVRDTFSAFKRYQDYAPALNAFNQVLVANGQAPLTAEGAIEFLRGRAPSEVYDIYEASSFREGAEAAGLAASFSANDAIRAALQTPGMTTPESVAQGMSRAAELLLRMRHEVNVSLYGLTHEELIDISLGLRPRSGRAQAEIGESINRAMSQAKAFTESQGTRPFTGFTDQGTPQARSLGRLRTGV